ncbi:MAG: hypothetical protein ABW184_09690 [Sphingobium sp.]
MPRKSSTVDLKGQTPLERDKDPLRDLSRAQSDAQETSDDGQPVTDHDPNGWRAIPPAKP